MRRVSIFGATGSVGQNTVDLISRAPQDYDVIALTGADNIAQLSKDAKALGAKVAVTAKPGKLAELQAALAGSDVLAAAGPNAITEAATRPCDWVMSAIVGVAGLAPGLAALQQGATLALANKESLVCAGALMLQTAKENDATILPVDSEHSAIFQALTGEDINAVERIILTASGGAFRDWPLAALGSATLAEASSHPNWDMGQRITIDSASMFNKAMEVIEVREFFRVQPDQIEVIIHPESLIHALVGFNDGALMAHLGPPDMRHAIGYALNWPKRRGLPVARLDLAQIGQLNFKNPDIARYPALKLARAVMDRGGQMGAAFNAAKERALDAFINRRIRFTDMAEVVEDVLTRFETDPDHIDAAMTLDNVTKTDHLARMWADQVMAKRAG
ncbi:MAG: 1-deoxy-D-xylulose-5-phosphate reductoisomerase [Rhodobacteraceae bacterium]|nr:1-deoxy-D-xylulose-5-phosphate reductoisomerase [Paracoccaceae bacterium]